MGRWQPTYRKACCIYPDCEQSGFNKTKCHLSQQVNNADRNFIYCSIVLFLSSLYFVWVLLLFKG